MSHLTITFKLFETDTFSSGGAYPGPNLVNKISGNMVGSGSDGRLGVNRTEIEGGNDAITSTGEYPMKYKRTVKSARSPESKKRKSALKKIQRVNMMSFDDFKNNEKE